MNKLFKKKDLTYYKGKLFKGDEAVYVGSHIVSQLNQLEEYFQKAKYYDKMSETKIVIPDEYEFESEHNNSILPVVNTPALNKSIKEMNKISMEKDELLLLDKIKFLNKRYQAAISFVKSNDVLVSYDSFPAVDFDLKYLGNPLLLSEQGMLNAFKLIAKHYDELFHFSSHKPICCCEEPQTKFEVE